MMNTKVSMSKLSKEVYAHVELRSDFKGLASQLRNTGNPSYVMVADEIMAILESRGSLPLGEGWKNPDPAGRANREFAKRLAEG